MTRDGATPHWMFPTAHPLEAPVPPRRLEAQGVAFEEIVIPDDTHHWMRHANALKVYKATAGWFERHLMPAANSDRDPRQEIDR